MEISTKTVSGNARVVSIFVWLRDHTHFVVFSGDVPVAILLAIEFFGQEKVGFKWDVVFFISVFGAKAKTPALGTGHPICAVLRSCHTTPVVVSAIGCSTLHFILIVRQRIGWVLCCDGFVIGCSAVYGVRETLHNLRRLC